MAVIGTLLNLSLSAALVVISGAFAGLTIALMTKDEIYLKVIAAAGEAIDQQNASKIIALLSQEKHWILVTLLLGNCIASEALPVILDRIVHGGLLAVLGSVTLIVIFSEIIPQSIFARYSLKIGAYMVPFVTAFMHLLAPVAWPVGKLLDLCVGYSHATGHKRTELMTTFALHEKLGSLNERLRSQEVIMVHGALGLRDAKVTSIMAPIQDVFFLRGGVLGYSYMSQVTIIGVFCVKQLLKYDPKSNRRAHSLEWVPIPIINARTNPLNVLKIFQEGKIDILLLAEKERKKILGVVTRKDVISSLLRRRSQDQHGGKNDLSDAEKSIMCQKRPNYAQPLSLCFQSILRKPEMIAVSAPDNEFSPLWAKSSLPANYGSFGYLNSASKWKYIRSYLPDSLEETSQEIELGTTYEA
ncbi:hypothetical protein N7450_006712 [Penicillium hetheringtonii]|uniref:CNNM transmembrane domain-containing protein n=1 Tax=Penicillium hetheringtonii TaxID=911720 RepID=A0AAD6DGD1_9EURO|nr:hypothetical protein N7450_006712 [Penicillium hetheringtonii]